MTKKKLVIAVDFDGTIVKEKYPGIGEPIENAFEILTRLHNDGHRLLLWTYRHGEKLEEAIDYCKKNGIEFYAANRNFPEEEVDETVPRKLLADIYIDDRSVGGLLDWISIYEYISGKTIIENKKQKKGFWGW